MGSTAVFKFIIPLQHMIKEKEWKENFSGFVNQRKYTTDDRKTERTHHLHIELL